MKGQLSRLRIVCLRFGVSMFSNKIRGRHEPGRGWVAARVLRHQARQLGGGQLPGARQAEPARGDSHWRRQRLHGLLQEPGQDRGGLLPDARHGKRRRSTVVQDGRHWRDVARGNRSNHRSVFRSKNEITLRSTFQKTKSYIKNLITYKYNRISASYMNIINIIVYQK